MRMPKSLADLKCHFGACKKAIWCRAQFLPFHSQKVADMPKLPSAHTRQNTIAVQ